ncbi:MAG: hypothetical protein MUD01_18710 [Chloroflexaceae bacterium]|jgi:hypothetical protein|nr:hypothetical protein [Chloroflexaceae bacterium]
MNNFFRYQYDKLGILLGWGVGNSIGGLLLLLVPSAFWRQFGMQAFSWGAIDAALAVFGRRGTRKKAARYAIGQLNDEAMHKEANRFRQILLINAGLDVLYIASGLFTAARYADRPGRRGMGLGIAVQGLFLLIYDALLARDVARRWRTTTENVKRDA